MGSRVKLRRIGVFKKKLDFFSPSLYIITQMREQEVSKEDLDKALTLLSQIVEKSEIDDRVENSKNPEVALNGDGWTTHHLKLVVGLLTKGEDS